MQKFELEGSQVSRQSHSQSMSMAMNGLDATSRTFNSLFPLFDQITKSTKIPTLLSLLVALFYYLQVIFSSTWPYTEFYRKASMEKSGPIIEKETLIFWFLHHDKSTKNTQEAIIISLVIFFVCAIWFIFMGTFYHFRRRYITWTLYPTRIIFEIVCLIFLHPSAAAAGSALMNLMDDYKNGLSWLLFILGIIVYLCFLIFFYIGYSLLCSGSILVTTIYSSFEPSYMVLMSITSSLMVFLSFLFYSFDYWVLNVLQVIHFASFLYILINLFGLHFHTNKGSMLAFSTLCTSIVLDIMMFIFNFLSHIMALIPIIVSYSLFVVLIIVGYFVFKLYFKRMAKKLKYPTDEDSETITNDDQEALFKGLHIDRNKNKALMFIRVGMEAMSKPFLDWTLVRYVVSHFQDDIHVLCSVLQILSFFPSQQQMMNSVFMMILKNKNLKFIQRFTAYQAHKVKVTRQSSIPLEANERILQLRINTNDCEYAINSFWGAKVTPSIGFFETISKITDKTDGLWQEGIRDYPNNSKFSEDYCRFLTECKTDFKGAIIQKHRIEMIENGHNFSSDHAFRQFIQNYPHYLKKKVLDVSGHIIKQSNKGPNASSSSSSQSKQSAASTASVSSIDFEIEMVHAKTLFSQSKLRMALYNALKNYRLSLTKVMIVTAIVSLIAAFAGFISMNIMIKNELHQRSLDSANSQTISDAFFYLNIAVLHHLFGFAKEIQLYPTSSLLSLSYLIANDNKMNIQAPYYIYFVGTIRSRVYPYFARSENSFQQFLDLLSEQSADGLNIYQMANSMLSDSVPSVACRNLTVSGQFNRSMKDVFSDLYYDLLRLNELDPTELNQTDAFCEIPQNLMLLSDPFMVLFSSLLQEQFKSYENYINEFKVVQYTIPIILFCVQFFPFLIVGILFAKKMKKFCQLLVNLDANAKEGCRHPILLNSDKGSDLNQSDHIEIGHRWVFLLVFHALLSIGSFLLLFFMIFLSTEVNKDFQNINNWQYLTAQRYILSIEVTHFIFELIFNFKQNTVKSMNNNFLIAKLSTVIPKMRQANTNLLRGDEYFGSIVGFDQEFDNINSKEICSISDPSASDSIHDLYCCASATQAVNVFADMVLTALMNQNTYQGKIEDPLLINLLHLANSHLFDRLADSNDRLVNLINIEYKNFCREADIFLAIGIILGVILLIFQIFASYYSHKLYHVGLSLVRRIPPTLFVADKALLNFVLNRRSTGASNITCPSQSVIHNANDGMVGVNNEGTVEMINPALTAILGYTPDQLLGQPITEIFKSESGEKVSQQMVAMTNGEASLINEDHFICLADNGNEIPCHVYIIGLKGKLTRIESYAFLVQDESSLVEQQTIAEKAKAQSEALLFQILPRSIVTKLNRGEHDISFSVPSASIIFTDIVRFSDYSSNLSPADVMGNLSQIFASFDEAVKNYPLITKIKLIGDIYMAAAGLFVTESDQIPPNQHAEQTIKFGLDCLQSIEDNNIKLDSSLQLRIGVNSGGPLLAGVLGSDKPVFDIIGDPINVAARLQTTDLPGRIQIPQSTYDLIANAGFLIEERGEVFLKGKGKTIAYFVNPVSATFTSLTDDHGAV